MPEKITHAIVGVQTEDDDKEDSQFELYIYQGANLIHKMEQGGGQNWPDGDYREFDIPLDVNVTGDAIRVVAGLRDGSWGRSNHWNATIEVIIYTNQNRRLRFGRFCAFRTSSRRRNHQMPIGLPQRFNIHGVRIS